jgi:hypothetical protein
MEDISQRRGPQLLRERDVVLQTKVGEHPPEDGERCRGLLVQLVESQLRQLLQVFE